MFLYSFLVDNSGHWTYLPISVRIIHANCTIEKFVIKKSPSVDNVARIIYPVGTVPTTNYRVHTCYIISHT